MKAVVFFQNGMNCETGLNIIDFSAHMALGG